MRFWKVTDPTIGSAVLVTWSAFFAAGQVCPPLLKIAIAVVLIFVRIEEEGSRCCSCCPARSFTFEDEEDDQEE